MAHIWIHITLTQFYYCHNYRTSIVREGISDKFCYNKSLSRNSYKKIYISSDRIGSQKLSRTYTKAKTFPLIRTVIQVSNQASSLLSHFVAVSTKLQQLQKKTKCHATEMSPKILNHIFRRPKTSCKKLEKNFRTG